MNQNELLECHDPAGRDKRTLKCVLVLDRSGPQMDCSPYGLYACPDGSLFLCGLARPGETRSCAGCHENPSTTTAFQRFPPSITRQPIQMLPADGEFTYRAKAWLKGTLPDEAEERNRTVRAVSLMGRY